MEGCVHTPRDTLWRSVSSLSVSPVLTPRDSFWRSPSSVSIASPTLSPRHVSTARAAPPLLHHGSRTERQQARQPGLLWRETPAPVLLPRQGATPVQTPARRSPVLSCAPPPKFQGWEYLTNDLQDGLPQDPRMTNRSTPLPHRRIFGPPSHREHEGGGSRVSFGSSASGTPRGRAVPAPLPHEGRSLEIDRLRLKALDRELGALRTISPGVRSLEVRSADHQPSQPSAPPPRVHFTRRVAEMQPSPVQGFAFGWADCSPELFNSAATDTPTTRSPMSSRTATPPTPRVTPREFQCEAADGLKEAFLADSAEPKLRSAYIDADGPTWRTVQTRDAGTR